MKNHAGTSWYLVPYVIFIYLNYYGSTDIDECLGYLHNCSAKERCINTLGGYTCRCPTGYARDLRSGKCEGKYLRFIIYQINWIFVLFTYKKIKKDSVNYLLSLTWQRTYVMKISDVDECTAGVARCMPGQVCFNTIGAFECRVECQDGFRYDPK